ncbi:Os06g0200600 [Oryza sativa Japonica Group]|uniref:Os06g0200600 protein n=1 Tax=Oryza sativa subsp. japonica TaxID=39947 RepID=Q69K47_ORYSJ|nr:unknown protein [Oryza sativa Japonica Group]BAD36654.1 unknown protein [Oryza sativa Japonica Group]BAF18985.1 Os06g0200600 [Oryza sativa Japonica Group]|eukprot:NP_001057071.1 Os06g0200600 [Oryza sativa Japonica Group]
MVARSSSRSSTSTSCLRGSDRSVLGGRSNVPNFSTAFLPAHSNQTTLVQVNQCPMQRLP